VATGAADTPVAASPVPLAYVVGRRRNLRVWWPVPSKMEVAVAQLEKVYHQCDVHEAFINGRCGEDWWANMARMLSVMPKLEGRVERLMCVMEFVWSNGSLQAMLELPRLLCGLRANLRSRGSADGLADLAAADGRTCARWWVAPLSLRRGARGRAGDSCCATWACVAFIRPTTP